MLEYFWGNVEIVRFKNNKEMEKKEYYKEETEL